MVINQQDICDGRSGKSTTEQRATDFGTSPVVDATGSGFTS